jgi:integrase
MLRAAGEVGMRRGEIIALRWPDVDLVARRVTIRHQVVQVRKPGGGHEKTVTPTKSGRDSIVALSRAMARRLADWYEESVIRGGASADGYVWPGRNGGPMHNRSLAQALERACIRAGLVEDPSADKPKALLSPHRLRHSAASVMLSAGVPVPAVAAQLTHANARVTTTINAHLVGDDLDRAASVFDLPDPGPEDLNGGGAGGGTAAEAEIPLQD